MIAAQPWQDRKKRPGEGSRRKSALLDIHVARSEFRGNLELWRNVKSEARFGEEVLGREIGLASFDRIIPDPKEPFGGITLIAPPAVKGPPVLTGTAGGIEEVEVAVNCFRSAGDDIPLGIF